MPRKKKEEVDQLHTDCVRTLRSLITEANHTCKLLGQIEKFPVSPRQRIEMIDQRQRENVASDRYHEARRRLFAAAKWDDT